MDEFIPRPTGIKPSVCVASGTALVFGKKYLATGDAIIDVGCGTKTFMNQMQAAGYHGIIGIDGYPYDDSIRQVNLGYDSLPFEDCSFEGGVAWEVLEHLENPYQLFREVKRILKPGGFFLLSVPNPGHIQSRVEMLLRGSLTRWSITNDHITVLSEEIVRKKFGTEMILKEISYGSPMLAPWRGRLIGKLNRSLPRNRLFGAFTLYAFQKIA